MVYSANTWKLASFHTYEDARNYYEKTKPWRGKDENVRPLGTRRQVNLTIRKVNDDYVCRFHQTDVVRFHPDNSITFEGYASMSTNGVAHRFTPPGYIVRYTDHGYFAGVQEPATDKKPYGDWIMTKVNRIFKLNKQADGSYMIEGTQPIMQTVVDQKESRRVYKETGYSDFAAYMKAAEKMNPPEEVPYWQKHQQRWSRWLNKQQLMEKFREGLTGWALIAEMCPRPTQTLDVVRKQLIIENNCIKTVERDDVSLYNLGDVMRSSNKWR